jgi:hypothetical protein
MNIPQQEPVNGAAPQVKINDALHGKVRMANSE